MSRVGVENEWGRSREGIDNASNMSRVGVEREMEIEGGRVALCVTKVSCVTKGHTFV